MFIVESKKIDSIDLNNIRRKEERVQVTLPINILNATYVTRNMSPSGIYFEANAPFESGSTIDFKVEFVNHSGNLFLECHGEIVRTDLNDDAICVAVKVTEATMKTATIR